MYECKICGRKYKTKEGLLRHYATHKEGEPVMEEKDLGIIPLRYFPKEVELIAENGLVGFKAIGTKDGDNVIINDIYLL